MTASTRTDGAARPRTPAAWRALALTFLLTATGIFYVRTIRVGRPGHNWGDDFGMYILHAKNLAEGMPYGNTGYIYNPDLPIFGPPAYPPIYPLLLAPVYKTFGLDLRAMKIETAALFLMFLAVFYLCAESRAGFRVSLLVTALAAFSPAFWDAKDNIISDVPFLLFAYGSLFLYDRWRNSSRSENISSAIGLGLVTYLAYGTRTVGLVLVPAYWAHEAIRFRKTSRGLMIATATFVVLAAIQSRLLQGVEGGYLKMWPYLDPFNLQRHLRDSVCELVQFIDNGRMYSEPWSILLFTGICSASGYVDRWRKGPSAFEIFPIFYLVVIRAWTTTAWPDQDYRHLMPVFPLFLLYAFHGLEEGLPSLLALLDFLKIHLNFPRYKRWLAIAGLALSLSLNYVSKYKRTYFGPTRTGMSSPYAVALFDYVRNRTKSDDVFIFSKPRALALFTGRRAAPYASNRSDDELWRFINSVRADYVIVGRPLVNDTSFLQPFLKRRADRFATTYTNRDFDVYRIIPSPSGSE